MKPLNARTKHCNRGDALEQSVAEREKRNEGFKYLLTRIVYLNFDTTSGPRVKLASCKIDLHPTPPLWFILLTVLRR